MNAITLVAEDETNLGNVLQIIGQKLALRVRRDKLVTGCGKCLERAVTICIRAHVDPLLTASSDLTRREKLDATTLDDMQSLHAEGITRSKDGSSVVWIVRGIHQDGDTVEARAENSIETSSTLGREQRIEHTDDGLLIEVRQTSEQTALRTLDHERMRIATTHESRARG